MLQKLFGFDASKHRVRTEIVAGITTFLTMSYVLAVNPSIFSNLASQGMDTPATFTATALTAIVGTLVMSFLAKKPFGLAPGMGVSTFFVYTVCLSMGHSWQFALTSILIEGILFVILTVSNIRKLIVDSIPASIKQAIGVGIGLFFAFIGLRNAGIIVDDPSTLVGLADLTQGSALLGVIGLMVTGVLVAKKVPAALLIGILVTALVGIPMGLTHFNGIVSAPPSIAPIFCQFEFDKIFVPDMAVVVLTFLFVNLFDTMGTIVGVCTKAGMIDSEGKIPGLNKALTADAVATLAGACLGTSATTTFLESATGVAQGGRTGLTSFTIAVCFALALFFAPLFFAIPAAATSSALVIVGLSMLSSIKVIDMDDFSEAFPAFITIIIMPLAYSISDGILCGMISYVAINALCGKFSKLNAPTCVLAVLFVLKYIFI